jgi:hypothetical protein
MCLAPKLTVDRNVILSVLNREPGYEFARRIFVAHANKSVVVAVSAANRVENSKNSLLVQSLDDMQRDCRTAGLIEPEILDYPLDWDMGLWEHSIVSEDGYDLELKIHDVLFPHISTYRADDQSARVRRKVSNAKCDVFALWGHTFFKRDYFLTNDKRFMKRKELLERLGACGICTPQKFVEAGIVCL